MRIKNVRVFTESQVFEEGEIHISDGLFTEKSGDGKETLDGGGCYAIPGLTDIHLHGCMGVDFCDGTPGALETIARYEASVGVTTFAPAVMTLPVRELEAILAAAADYRKNDKKHRYGADLAGINMEGPFISRERKGAQNGADIIPCSAAAFRRFQRAAEGLVKYIAIAPEIPGALPFLEQVRGEVRVSVGHTDASYEQAKEAFDRGACHAVHLYNGMAPFTSRAPGAVGAVCDSGHVTAELICDRIHVHPSVVRATFKMLGRERIILISDSMRGTGMPDGLYTLGGQSVRVEDRRATLEADGALAGSVTDLMDCMRIAVREMGIPLEDAVTCAAVNPAKSLGEYGTYGSISPGKKAHLVLLDQTLNIRAVFKDGERIR